MRANFHQLHLLGKGKRNLKGSARYCPCPRSSGRADEVDGSWLAFGKCTKSSWARAISCRSFKVAFALSKNFRRSFKPEHFFNQLISYSLVHVTKVACGGFLAKSRYKLVNFFPQRLTHLTKLMPFKRKINSRNEITIKDTYTFSILLILFFSS